jgi:hypothetical protein
VVEDNHAITLVPCTLREAVGNERSIAIARRGIHRSKSFFIVALIRSIHPLQILFGSDRSVRINVKSSNADLRRVNSIEGVQVDVLFARHPKRREQKKQEDGEDPHSATILLRRVDRIPFALLHVMQQRRAPATCAWDFPGATDKAWIASQNHRSKSL